MTTTRRFVTTKGAADRIAAEFGGFFDGRRLVRESDTTFALTGSHATHRKFEEALARLAPRAPTATPAPLAEAPTPRQIAFLSVLIARDPGAAMTVGASPDGARVASGLSRAQVSRMIDMLRAGV